MNDTALDRLARRYPGLDLQSLRILTLVADNPGASMSDIAEQLGTRHQYVQFHIAMMASGKTGREKQGLHLLLVEPDLFDKRRKNLRLTPAGERIIKAIKPLLRQ